MNRLWKTASVLSRNPLGIIALCLVFLDGFMTLVFGISIDKVCFALYTFYTSENHEQDSTNSAISASPRELGYIDAPGIGFYFRSARRPEE